MAAQGKGNGVHGENGVTFEQSFGRLQEVVQRLSEGSLTLQEALTSFEEGMALADMCLQMLDEAESRLRQVSARTARSAAQALEDLDAAYISNPRWWTKMTRALRLRSRLTRLGSQLKALLIFRCPGLLQVTRRTVLW